MHLTQTLKDFLVEHFGVAKDASDEEFRAAAGKALADEKSVLTIEKFQELTAPPQAAEANDFLEGQREIIGLLKETIELSKTQQAGGGTATATATGDDGKSEGTETPPADPKDDKTPTPTVLEKAIVSIGGEGFVGYDSPDMREHVNIRMKADVERYSTDRKAMVFPDQTKQGAQHRMAGQRVSHMGRSLELASDRDKAQAGVWAKYQLLSVTPKLAGSPSRAWEMLSDHERGLLGHLAEEGMWDDSINNRHGSRKGYPGGIKALIDDAPSGGLEAAPIVFDDQVIEAPLLFGELFPQVNTVSLERGRRVEGVIVGRVTGTWGGVDDTAITLFNTASYVSAFDTTIFRWEGSIVIGLDFLSDTPIDFGATITRQYGERFLEDIDDVIATGNGTTQPEGVINKSGATSIAFGGATSIGNYESLRFGVAKPEHSGPLASTAVYCGTETSYQRVRALPVGASDARRLFGIDHFGPGGGGYTIDGGAYKINESLTNAQIFYTILGRYRMYRRKGFTVRTSTEGDTLIRNNEMLIVVMARYGGQVERGAAVAITTTAPV